MLAASAGAKIVTVGSPLQQSFEPSACNLTPCTVIPTGFEDSSALVASPITGTVIRWRIFQAAPPFQYRLRLVDPLGLATFIGAGGSAPATPAGPGIETFQTQIPIQAGQQIGLDLPADGPIGFLQGGTTSSYAFIEEPPLGEGETRTLGPGELENEGELAFNADVQPPPTVAAYSPPGGPINGGTAVTIIGTDLAGATSVTFGGIRAVSYSVDSENQVTAITPPFPNPGTYAIRVTTRAGGASPIAAFAVGASSVAPSCKVPDVKGKHLKGAKKRIRKAGCGVGKLTKLKGATAKTGKVRRTSPKAGASVPSGSKVRIVLAP
ncbi:MAG TPA: PASTA domain-containing protein [Solirubrobacterales bacterium]